MSLPCYALHQLMGRLPLHAFPFDEHTIPENGIYVLFEEGEKAHGQQRIVRVGTHTGNRQLRSRLRQHFIVENKDRSIFRKNIGRALLNRSNDPFLADWNLDLTTAAAKRLHANRIDASKQRAIETQVTAHIRPSFRFVVILVADKTERLHLESRMISTVAQCSDCSPSRDWLGRSSPVLKIRESGLWQVNELAKAPFCDDEFNVFERIILLDLQ